MSAWVLVVVSLTANVFLTFVALKKKELVFEEEEEEEEEGRSPSSSVGGDLETEVAGAIRRRQNSSIWRSFDNLSEHVAAIEALLPSLLESVASSESSCACENASLCARIAPRPDKEVLGYGGSVLDLARGGAVERKHWKTIAARLTTVVGGAYSDNWSSDRLCDAHANGVRFLLGNPSASANLPKCQSECGCAEWCDACDRPPYWNCFFNTTNVAVWIAEALEKVGSRRADGLVFDVESHAHGYAPYVGTQVFYDAYGLFGATYTALVALTTSTARLVLPGAIFGAAVAWAPTGVDGRFYDYAGLAAGLDFLFVMDYCVRSQVYDRCVAHGNGYMDVTHGWQQYLAAGVPSNKLFAGVNWAGQSWPCIDTDDHVDVCRVPLEGGDGFRGVNCTDAVASEIDFSDAQAILRNRSRHQKRLVAERRFDPYTKLAYFNWRSESGGLLHQTWFDDVEALTHKYAAAATLRLGGVGPWTFTKLNYSSSDPLVFNDTTAMWTALDVYLEEEGR
ncbi:hypothetical protein CTAYLR_000051 [Chrysophaeum taylorii]|uniref:GH18 domain-containing protein n=1 Tax=Chrysophaeum taylorii TaxID=2483200 RepID=A0AAD7XQR1_9STRA|nr:hypothetical protein CTAYLR_000051 [Chrysophaeum taylorii]